MNGWTKKIDKLEQDNKELLGLLKETDEHFKFLYGSVHPDNFTTCGVKLHKKIQSAIAKVEKK